MIYSPMEYQTILAKRAAEWREIIAAYPPTIGGIQMRNGLWRELDAKYKPLLRLWTS